MPDPHIYPEPPAAPLLLEAAVGAPVPVFTLIEQLAAPDPTTPEIPKTMFIRVAVSGADCMSATSATAPNFYLSADTGDAVLINDHAQLPGQTYPIFRMPGANPVDFIGEGSVFFEGDNVLRLVVAFSDSGGEFVWRLGIWNNDGASARLFTWVVSGTLANTSQPWIDLSPNVLSFEFDPGTHSQNITINNRGTGLLRVTNVVPALAAPFSLQSPLPLSVRPNSPPESLEIGFESPDEPVGFPMAARIAVSSNDPGPFGAGHNNAFDLSATVPRRPPRFTASPQFQPRGGRPGRRVTLFGQNFDAGNLSVQFGQFRATDVVTSATKITAVVPDMPTDTTVRITVQTDDGAATSDDTFLVLPFPTVDKVDPIGGHAGDEVVVSGQNLMLGGERIGAIFEYDDTPFGQSGTADVLVVATSATQIVLLVPDVASHHDHVEGILTIHWHDGDQSWSWTMEEEPFIVAIL